MASAILQQGLIMRKKHKHKHKQDPFRTYEEAHSYGRATGRLTYYYEMAVKMRDSKNFNIQEIAKYTKLPIKTILVL